MSLNERDLLNLKEEINDAKTRSAELIGEQKGISKQFKEEFACANIEEAEKQSEKIQNAISAQEKKIAKATEELEEKMAEYENNTE